MKRTRTQGRSGIFQRKPVEAPKPARTPEEIKAVFEEIRQRWQPAKVSASAFDLINKIEAQALAIYGKHGLPTVQGAYWREGQGSPWIAMSLATEPGGKWEPTGLAPQMSGQGAHLSEIAKYDHPEDSEVGFSATLLRMVRNARSALNDADNAGAAGAAIAFNAGADLMLAWTQWREEFALAGWIEPERLVQPRRSYGGEQRAVMVRADREPQWADWQAEAERIWAVMPALSKTAVALRVINRLKLSEGERAVRNRITKPERC